MIVTLKHKRKDSWSGVYKYKNCYDYIAPFLTRSGNAHTGLTESDSKRLEKALNFAEDTLAPFSKYWDTFAVKISNNELTLDTDRAWDELQYLFLKNHKRVADGLGDQKPHSEWILINKESEAKEANISARKKREALREFDKMSMDDMRKCLRIYGYRSDSMSNELVESRLFELIEKEPDRFFSKWVNNKSKMTEFVIEAAVSKNIIRKSKNMYYYGTDVIGTSLEDAIATLDDKKNNDLRLGIMSGIEEK